MPLPEKLPEDTSFFRVRTPLEPSMLHGPDEDTCTGHCTCSVHLQTRLSNGPSSILIMSIHCHVLLLPRVFAYPATERDEMRQRNLNHVHTVIPARIQ
jgi:hypothetical protein